MFTVLEVQPYVRPLFFRRLFSKPLQPTVEKVAVRGGAFFYKATAFADKNGCADLSFLPSTVGIAAQRIVPCGEEMSELPTPLQFFSPKIFPTVLFVNTVCAFLEKYRDTYSACTVGILDEDARLRGMFRNLVPLSKAIRVFCRTPAAYADLQSELLESHGLSLVVCDSQTVLRDCGIVLRPFEKTADGAVGTLTVRQGGKAILAGEGITLPQEYKERMPQNTNALLFASALYECCNVTQLQNLQYTRFVPIKTAGIY